MIIRKYFIQFVFLFFLVLGFFLFYFNDFLTIDYILENKEYFESFKDVNIYILLLVMFVLTFISALSPFPLLAYTMIVNGFLFGVYYGSIFNFIVTLFSSVVTYYLSKYYFHKIDVHSEKLIAFKRKFVNSSPLELFQYLVSLRFIMVFPFFFINLFSGFFNIRSKIFYISTVIGIVPACVLYAYFGYLISISIENDFMLSTDFYLSVFIVILLININLIYKLFKRLYKFFCSRFKRRIKN